MARDERATLLEVHQALPEEQFQSLKFLLEGRVPAGLLLPASRPELCRILLQRFPGNSLRVTAGILRQLGRLDLIQRFQLPLEEQIPEETPWERNGDTPEGWSGAGWSRSRRKILAVPSCGISRCCGSGGGGSDTRPQRPSSDPASSPPGSTLESSTSSRASRGIEGPPNPISGGKGDAISN
ncbi:uncharacterized protein LOC125337950 isoform X2 [Corvus hawaiiensis]|uniref:uncharacterized protein LOC125337950 isoform X2 n=1 Tax=Corvus hawaiiensis TaxID=134902 RepID=UPI00201851AB|nr:uncharacterized protein LOC125337950 isoform X2 [Corvus hawaiiensis]